MKKGDLKKAELIQTAEMLFCRNGYEQTSVQDILDVLQTSKGSFYHHFPSKEALLEAMCAQRASALALEVEDKTSSGGKSVMEKLNICLEGMMPLSGERINFLLMILPVFDLPEGWSVKHAYKASLTQAFLPILSGILEEGHQEGCLFCPHASIQAQLTLLLANDLWDTVCDRIIQAEKRREYLDLSQLLEYLDQSRLAIEKILSAPYGSIKLFDLPEIKSISEQIHVHWKTI